MKRNLKVYSESRVYPPYFLKAKSGSVQASLDEDDRLRTVHLSTYPCGQRTKILGSDRPSRGLIRTTDHDNNFEMDEWTDF